MLGRALTLVLEEAFPCTISATRAEIDVTDRSRVEAEVERLRPGVLINCAALGDPGACEEDPLLALRVNAEGAENAARAAAAGGCRLVHLSTALVFDGHSRTPYKESDPADPPAVCGRTRLEGERRVAAVAPDHLIVRTSWLFGEGCAALTENGRERARAGGNLGISGDELGSPTSATDLAEAVLNLLSVSYSGVVHFANSGVCSRRVLGRAILEAVGDGRMGIEPCAAAGPGTAAVRSANVALDSTLYSRLTGVTPRSWRTALGDFLRAGAEAAGA